MAGEVESVYMQSGFGHEVERWTTVASKKKAAPKPQQKRRDSFSQQPLPSDSTGSGSSTNVPCRFYQLGQCSKGSKCPFLHKKAPPHFSTQTCKFFQNGFCRNGDKCPFAHEIAKPEKVAPSFAPTKKESTTPLASSSWASTANTSSSPKLSSSPLSDIPKIASPRSQTSASVSPPSPPIPFDLDVPDQDDSESDASMFSKHPVGPGGEVSVLPFATDRSFVAVSIPTHYSNSPGTPRRSSNASRRPDFDPGDVLSSLLDDEPAPSFKSALDKLQTEFFNEESDEDESDEFELPKSGFGISLGTPPTNPIVIPRNAYSPNIASGSSTTTEAPGPSSLNSLFDLARSKGSLSSSPSGGRPRLPSGGSAVAPILSPPTQRFSPRVAHDNSRTGNAPPSPSLGPMRPTPSSAFYSATVDDELNQLDWTLDDIEEKAAFVTSPRSSVPPTQTGATKPTPIPQAYQLRSGAYVPPALAASDTSLSSSVGSSRSTSSPSPPPLNPKPDYSMDSPADGNSYLPGLEKKKQLCMYYMDGGCRFGEYCKFVHGLQCSICEKPYLYPDDPVQNEKHTSQCELEKERETSEHLKCEMCNKKVVDSGRKFGILPSCDCVFCVPCIREVRNNALESECPVCGKASHFVVPCYGWPRNAARKELVVSLYREKLRKIPCKYFDNGKGTCRFGSACHYAHVDTEGNAVVPEQARAVVDARGEYQQYSTLNLGMFLNIQKKEKKKS